MTVTERRLGWITVNGQEYPRDKTADWVEAINQGLCPFCGAGPFQAVAIHANKRHGIDRFALRDLLGVTYNTPITHPEYHKRRQAITRAMMDAGQIGNHIPGFGGGSPGPGGRLSHAAKQHLRTLNRVRTPESRKAQGKAMSNRHREAVKDRDAGIVAALKRGDTHRQIMDRFGISEEPVLRIAREHGLMRRSKDQVDTARDRLRDEAASGKPLGQLADEAGVTRRVMRKRLARAGVWPLPLASNPPDVTGHTVGVCAAKPVTGSSTNTSTCPTSSPAAT